jgi:hypothetical protein
MNTSGIMHPLYQFCQVSHNYHASRALALCTRQSRIPVAFCRLNLDRPLLFKHHMKRCLLVLPIHESSSSRIVLTSGTTPSRMLCNGQQYASKQDAKPMPTRSRINPASGCENVEKIRHLSQVTATSAHRSSQYTHDERPDLTYLESRYSGKR